MLKPNTVLSIFLVIVVLGIIFILFFQDLVILHPKKLPMEYAFKMEEPFEEVNFHPTKDVTINGLFFKVKNPKGVVFYNHGNADNLQRWAMHSVDFTCFGYDVFFYDFRGFGKSSGKFSEKEVLSDALFLFDKTTKNYENVIIYGRSLGSGIATYLAKNRKPKALILETPYYNLADVAKQKIPFIPFEKIVKYKFPSNEWIVDVKAPVYIFHGTSDDLVPYESGLKLSKVANSKMITVQGATHKNIGEFEIYHKTLAEILK